jgi:hypothetical protein
MRSAAGFLFAASAALVGAACSTPTENQRSGATSLVAAFQSVPFAFSNVSSTFAAAAAGDSTPWCPPGRGGPAKGEMGGREGPGGPGGPPLAPFMMGGGLGEGFLGLGFGPGFGQRPPGEGDPFASCAYDSATGRVDCAAETRNGLTIVRSAQYKDAGGVIQTAFDNLLTNSINTRISVSGTVTRRDGDVSTVQHQSDRTVTGLAQGSIERTVNGTSSGTESTTGTDSTGAFTAVRTAGDTVQGVVIPVSNGVPSDPVTGSVIRSMSIVVTYAGASPTTSARRETITYDGSDTAKLTITHDGVTRSCTLPLPRGRITCS